MRCYIKRGKVTPLGHSYEGPFEILERLGDSCIKVKVGHYASGQQREEIQHWQNAKPAHVAPNATQAEKPARGRKPARSEVGVRDPLPPTTPAVPPAPSHQTMKPPSIPKSKSPENIETRPIRAKKKPLCYAYD